MSTSTSKTTNESRLGPKQSRYLFTTKCGTEPSTFKEYIKTLPDKGEGDQIAFGRVPFQSYVTTLTHDQAKDVANQSFIAYVVLAGETKDREFIGDSNASGSSSEQSSNKVQDLQARLTSDQHLRLISTSEQDMKSGMLPNYLFDPHLGCGQTIYILDSGFNVNHEEFGGDRSVETKVVPNWLTLEDVPDPSHWWPEDDITDYTGHGTLAASIAAGRTYGVASRANLVLVKFKQRAYNPKSENWPFRGVTNSALAWAWRWILVDALGKRPNGHSGQFIVNMNCGKCSPNSRRGKLYTER
jgi:subtilisin family serine protease